MKRKTIYIFAAVMIILVSIWLAFIRTSTFDAIPPKLDTSTLLPLPNTSSTITLPIYVPIETVRDFLQSKIPQQFSGTETERVIDTPILRVSATTSWAVKRTNLTLVSNDGLTLTSNISGEGHIYVKRLGRVLRAKLSGSFGVVARPVITTNWRLSVPNLRLTARLGTAKVRILGGWFNVREIAQSKLNRETKKLSSILRNQIAEEDFLEVASKKHWRKLCQSFPLGSDTGLWLEVKPVSAQVAQPGITDKNIRLQLGLIAKTRVVARKTMPVCPFPQALVIEPPRSGRVEIAVPAEISYSALQDIISLHVVDKRIGKDVTVTIKDISLRPHGESLLLKTLVVIRHSSWLGTRAEGTLYLSARPMLNTEEQTIKLVDIELDTASRNVLVAIAGEAIEPIVLDAIKGRATVELQPLLGDELQGKANAAIRGLSSSGFALDGKVKDIRLIRLNVGPSHLQLIGSASAKVGAAVQTIEAFGR